MEVKRRHPFLSRIIQAEADRLAHEFGRSRTEIPPQPSEEPYRIVGMSDDVDRHVALVYPDGRVERS